MNLRLQEQEIPRNCALGTWSESQHYYRPVNPTGNIGGPIRYIST